MKKSYAVTSSNEYSDTYQSHFPYHPEYSTDDSDFAFDPMCFHKPRRTWVCLAYRNNEDHWHQDWVPTWKLNGHLKTLNLRRDLWISQAEFTARIRDIDHVACLQSSFIDLDWKKSELYIQGKICDPEMPEAVEMLIQHCHKVKLPIPSVIVFSGNGFHVKWIYNKALPAKALKRWNAVQQNLCKKLSIFGADSSALDAARVLRVPCTINTKWNVNDPHVRVVFTSCCEYKFDDIAKAVLPFDRETVRKMKKSVKCRAQKASKKAYKPVFHSNHMNITLVARKRYEDLLTLMDLRRNSSGDVDEGRRELTVFWALVFAASAGILHLSNFDYFVNSLIERIGGNFSRECSPRTFSTLRSIIVKIESGIIEKEWDGKKVPILYRATNATLIKILQITPEEQKAMSIIIGRDEKKERRLKKRRAAGIQSREEWLAEHDQERRKPWEAEGISRRTWFKRKALKKAAMAELTTKETAYNGDMNGTAMQIAEVM